MPPDFKPYMTADVSSPGDSILCRWVRSFSTSGDDVELGALNSWWMDKRSRSLRTNRLMELLRGKEDENHKDNAEKGRREFGSQESVRFSQPDACFVYRCRGKEFLVGPVENR